MSAALTRLKTNTPVRWTTIVGILLVPLTVAGLLLWGLWQPTERLANVTAAVVNNDAGAEVDGQTVPLGRLLAGELIAGDAEENFTWTLTDADDATAGLDDGRYASVVTIPENFSEAATSLSGDPEDAEQAVIDIAQSDRGRLIDTALSGIVTQTATSVVNEQLGEQFIDGIYVGFNTLGDGVGDAADGATQLADGTRELAGGAQDLADGTTQLATGATELATGTQELSGGVSQLADGAWQLSDGTAQLTGGTRELATGASQLSDGATQLSDGIGQYVGGADTLAQSYDPLEEGATAAITQLKTLVQTLTGLQEQLAAPSQQLADGLGAAGDGLAQAGAGAQTAGDGVAAAGDATAGLGSDTETLVAECMTVSSDPAYCDRLATTLGERTAAIGAGLETAGSGLDTVGGGVTSAGAGLETAGAGATGMGDVLAGLDTGVGGGAGDPAAQLDQLIAGLAQFGDGLNEFAGQGGELTAGAQASAAGTRQLSGGVSELAASTPQLADGAAQLADGTGQLAANVPQLADGAIQLADGTTELADGTDTLADGTTELADGAGSLASGLGEAADGVPTTTEQERSTLATVAATPVKAEGASDELFNSAGVPLFAGIALWAGALAVFLVLAPLWSRTRDAARGVGYITLRSTLPALGLGAIQGALAGVILPIALGYDLGQGATFFGFALLAGIAFSLFVQGLSALLGGLGRFIAFALLVVAFAVGIVSTVPSALAGIGDASPVGSALAGFQAIAAQVAGAGGNAVALALWGIGGVVLTALAVLKTRRA